MRVERRLVAGRAALRRGEEVQPPEHLRPRAVEGVEGAALDQVLGLVDAGAVWERIESFASFGFCKAHAVTYGRIAFQAVYLKAHHPAPYLAAFLNSETGYYDARVYVEEARRLGVAILPPDVNKSGAEFRLEWPAGNGQRGAIRVGLARRGP